MQCKRWDTNFEKNKHKAQPIYDTIQIESVKLTKKKLVFVWFNILIGRIRIALHIQNTDPKMVLYIFHVNTGGMLTFDMEVALQT